MPLVGNSPKSFYAGLRSVPIPDEPKPQFPNPDFEQDFDFWDIKLEWQAPSGAGTTNNTTPNRNIAGCIIPPDPTPFPIGKDYDPILKVYVDKASPGQANKFLPNVSFSPTGFKAEIVPGGPQGKYAQLSLRGNVQPFGSTVYGPALVSQFPVIGAVGDRISFNWTAQGGGDAFNVLAYIINKENCKYFIMLDATGDSAAATRPWEKVSKVLGPGEAGNYTFVFICGTFDYTFGGAVGALLGVDSIVVEKAGTY